MNTYLTRNATFISHLSSLVDDVEYGTVRNSHKFYGLPVHMAYIQSYPLPSPIGRYTPEGFAYSNLDQKYMSIYDEALNEGKKFILRIDEEDDMAWLFLVNR